MESSDIYFEEDYGRIYESMEKGKVFTFLFEDELGTIKHMFIKREIPLKVNNQLFYDITTPYGYGGPIIEKGLDENKSELLLKFQKQFEKFCKDNNIVSEFIRYHPIYQNAKDFNSIYETLYMHDTVGTNLKKYDDPFESEFTKKCRQNIRKALKKGVSYNVSKNVNIEKFKQIYYSTMNRNNASDYYYFDENYFKDCLKYFKNNLIFVEAIYQDNTIAAGLYFIWNKTIHIHLSGTLSEYLYLSPAYILRYAVTLWGKENGYELIHHGGGRTNDENDGLFKFKKQFGINTSYKFYIGKKIWNYEIYNKLMKLTGNPSNDYFPAYRKRK